MAKQMDDELREALELTREELLDKMASGTPAKMYRPRFYRQAPRNVTPKVWLVSPPQGVYLQWDNR